MADLERNRRAGIGLGTLMFGFAVLVDAVILLKESQLDLIGYALVIASPFALGGIGYLVGSRHDENASD